MLLQSHTLPPITVSPIKHPKTDNLYLARLDLLPYPAGGNKWFKLKYNLLEAQRLGIQTLITFGGAYSNHLYATAEAAEYFGFKSIGIIRGEEHVPLNDTLQYCVSKGMQLFYLSREDYRKKNDPAFIQAWMSQQNIPLGYLIPEGGSTIFAVKGVQEIISLLPQDTDIIATACGTGGTLAGILAGLKSQQEAWGFSALKGGGFLLDEVQHLLSPQPTPSALKLFLDYHMGGYAKLPDELLAFVKQFNEQQGIALDPTYTSKLLFGLFDLADKGLLPKDKKIVALHTGGLQAWDGLPEKKRIFLSE
ncbi:MAG: 1-aminocyclopropane-carboxylate deaminase [Cytophagaceae bacterium]|jgi:1-aminocyclopropane-1-carboxylate deaminase/D-cysteine desulfhydrase-like pyridoxal-dependent ACC family enzyme|nr:1-aminocyclopropane-carboxylate deaminase [Cytophagaceae bacterium]